MEKIIGLIILCSLLIFGIYFLDKGKLGAGTFTTYMSITLICGLAFYGFDRLKELDIKNLRMILTEMKETKRDIEKEVNLLHETLAFSNISSALETGRFASDNLQYEMIKKRERARELLKKANWSDAQIEAETRKIDLYILGDIADTIRTEASRSLHDKKTEDGKPLHLKFQEEFPKLRESGKVSKDKIDEARAYLRKYQIPEDEFKPIFEDMEYFIETRQLKRPIHE
ncbi:MAG: hypothetical protein Q8O13_09335 [Candidatus Omnitrophota bacterium]|nr:hypothetical protein [Candidatus Omnitrophota bacterium]